MTATIIEAATATPIVRRHLADSGAATGAEALGREPPSMIPFTCGGPLIQVCEVRGPRTSVGILADLNGASWGRIDDTIIFATPLRLAWDVPISRA